MRFFGQNSILSRKLLAKLNNNFNFLYKQNLIISYQNFVTVLMIGLINKQKKNNKIFKSKAFPLPLSDGNRRKPFNMFKLVTFSPIYLF